MTAIHLCANCLSVGAKPYPVGHEKGSQRDPYHTTHDLCEPCSTALEEGWFGVLKERHRAERVVERGEGAAP